MKALTIHQPYAHLIVIRKKLVENRTWATKYRGPLLIHAGKSHEWLGIEDPSKYVMGAIVGVADLVDCLPASKITQGYYEEKYPGLQHHEHVNGPWCWVLANARPVQPVSWKGAQGLWNVSDADEILSGAAGEREQKRRAGK